MSIKDTNASLGNTSLLEGLVATPAPGRLSLRDRARAAWDARVARVRHWIRANPAREQGVRRAGWIAAGLLVVGMGIGGWVAFAPRTEPDYFEDPFDDVLDFTLLTEEFNRLPIERRLELLRDLIKRVGSMDGSESELIAAFAGGIAGKAREQLEKNASKLVMDLFDKQATEYASSTPDHREKAIDTSVVELFRTLDALDGKESTQSDEEILSDARDEAKRGKEWIKKTDREQLGRNTGRMMATLNDTVGKHTNPQQKARMGVLMRDMTRRLRGESVR
jgi:hypothetical protein